VKIAIQWLSERKKGGNMSRKMKKKNEMNEGCNFPKDCVRTKKGDE